MSVVVVMVVVETKHTAELLVAARTATVPAKT
jgi:hypothetical protein